MSSLAVPRFSSHARTLQHAFRVLSRASPSPSNLGGVDAIPASRCQADLFSIHDGQGRLSPPPPPCPPLLFVPFDFSTDLLSLLKQLEDLDRDHTGGATKAASEL
jgi:hypothetical protein